MSSNVVLITGASSGIGFEAAKLFKNAGFDVFAAARRIDRMKSLADLGINILRLDVTDEVSMSAVVDEVVKKAGRVDVLVNNAGYGSFGAVEDVPLVEAKRQFEVNVFGLARMTQLVLPLMRAQGGGRIINVSSIAGKIYEPCGAWYHSTKFAVEGLSDCLRLEVRDFGVSVSLVEPGLIKTEWDDIAISNMLKLANGSAYERMYGVVEKMFKSFYKRASEPVVIAKVILRAATEKRPRTRYVAGANSRLFLLARRVLSDRAFDWMLMKIFS